MKKKKECAWTRSICQKLEAHGCKVRSIVASRMQQPGWPDRWVTHRLWHGHLEFKGEDTVLTALQRIVIRDINLRQPGTAFVVRCAQKPNWPEAGRIEDHDGKVLHEFDNVRGLLAGLHHLRASCIHSAKEDTSWSTRGML